MHVLLVVCGSLRFVEGLMFFHLILSYLVLATDSSSRSNRLIRHIGLLSNIKRPPIILWRRAWVWVYENFGWIFCIATLFCMLYMSHMLFEYLSLYCKYFTVRQWWVGWPIALAMPCWHSWITCQFDTYKHCSLSTQTGMTVTGDVYYVVTRSSNVWKWLWACRNSEVQYL